MSAWHGVFGKLPEAGDFVARGLPAPVRRGIDRWLSQTVAGLDAPWPEGGLRGLLIFETPALFIAVPSRDKVGRRFPLAALTAGDGASLEEAERWCDMVYPVLSAVSQGTDRLADLLAALDTAPDVACGQHDGEAAIWIKGGRPMTPDASTLAELGLKKIG